MQDGTGVWEIKGVAAELACDRFSDGEWTATTAQVPMEREVRIYVNLQELVTILCTPSKVNFLVLGFLYAEGIISGLDDVLMMRVCDDEFEVDVRLTKPEFVLPTKRRLTSGCGGGASFSSEGKKVESRFVADPVEILGVFKQLQARIEEDRFSTGIHTSALADTKELIAVCEDIGRHNTVDKIQGECLMERIPTKDRLLLTTGRVSSEMLLKAARMQVPVVVSRHSPTGTAALLARELGIALVGRARGGRMTVYSHPERLGCSID